jgi:hypothetical protein
VSTSGPVANGTITAKVAALVPILTGLGGVNVDWVVWSSKLRTSVPVTDWHVDNAFDTQRRRGIGATVTVSGTTSEASAPNFFTNGPVDDQAFYDEFLAASSSQAGSSTGPADRAED